MKFPNRRDKNKTLKHFKNTQTKSICRNQSQEGNWIALDTRLLISVFKIRNSNALNPRIPYHLNQAVKMMTTLEWYVPVGPALRKTMWDGKVMLASFSQHRLHSKAHPQNRHKLNWRRNEDILDMPILWRKRRSLTTFFLLVAQVCPINKISRTPRLENRGSNWRLHSRIRPPEMCFTLGGKEKL